MRRKLVVASGGSGDLVTAYALARAELLDHTEAFAAPIWERTALDPEPGPRGREKVANLVCDICGWRVIPETRLPGGWSPLPRFVSQTGIRLYYLDADLGVSGVAEQLQRLCETAGIDLVELVDAGGDVLARGDEAGLRSPALDSVLLAACSLITVQTVVTVVGEGLDGELSLGELAQARQELPAPSAAYLPRTVAREAYARSSWFPSEASLMTLLAAAGVTADVDIRADTYPVHMDRNAAAARTYPLDAVLRRNKLAGAIRHSTSMTGVDATLRALGCVSELSREQARSDSPAIKDAAGSGLPGLAVAPVLDSVHPRATHISLRRLCSVLGLRTRHQVDALDALLAGHFGPAYRKPLLPVRAIRDFRDIGVIRLPTTAGGRAPDADPTEPADAGQSGDTLGKGLRQSIPIRTAGKQQADCQDNR